MWVSCVGGCGGGGGGWLVLGVSVVDRWLW